MEEEAKGLSPRTLQRCILKCFSLIFPGVAVCWPLVGLPLQGLVSITHHKKENIQADPRVAHTQSKANTRCHIRGLSHVLTCFCLFMPSPACPEWYPHHPIGWLTPSNRKGLLPWPTMLTQGAVEEPGWVTSYPVQAVLHLEHGNVEIKIYIFKKKKYHDCRTLHPTFTWLSGWVMSVCCSWERSR